MKRSKAAWIWLIIPAINIPLGVGIYMVVKSQIQAINIAAANKQAELVARTEQLEREKQEAEQRAVEAEAEAEAAQNQPPARPYIVVKPQPDSAPEREPLVLTVTCDARACEDWEDRQEDVVVVVAAEVELEVPNGWTRQSETEIQRYFRYEPTIGLTGEAVEVKSADGRTAELHLFLAEEPVTPPTDPPAVD